MKSFYLSIFLVGVIATGNVSFAQTTEPPPRTQPALAYMDHLGLAILFGGQSEGKLLNDTWIWKEGWQKISPALSPEARKGHAMAYDSRTKLVYLFGGKGEKQ